MRHPYVIYFLFDRLTFFFLIFGKFWTVRSIESVTCFSLFSQYITVENLLCHTSSRLTLLSRAVLTLSSALMQEDVWAVACDCRYREHMVKISVNGGICSTPGVAQHGNPTHDLRNFVHLASSLSIFVFVSSWNNWNNLNPVIRNATSLNIFKSAYLKSHFNHYHSWFFPVFIIFNCLFCILLCDILCCLSGPYWKSASCWICYPGKIKVSWP